MNIVISDLTESDREAWEKLYSSYAAFYKMPMNQEILDTVWSWIFDKHNKFFALIARNDNGERLGLMHYREMPSPIRDKAVGFLDDLYVNPQARCQGVVDALYQALEESARKQGSPFVRWITAKIITGAARYTIRSPTKRSGYLPDENRINEQSYGVLFFPGGVCSIFG